MAYAEPTTPESALEKPNPDLDEKDRTTRVESAIALRAAGANYSEIAEFLGYATVDAARSAVERGLASTVTNEDRKTMRAIANRRIERLLASIDGKATNPKNPEQLAAVRTALALIDRHAKMNGYDAPTEVAVYSPTERQMQDFLAEQAERIVASLPKEVDIVKSEVVRDSGERQAG